MSGHITCTTENGIVHLCLNRAEKRNALNGPMIESLHTACRDINAGNASLVLLSSEGGTFCAGGDIDAWSQLQPEAFGRHWIANGHRAFDALARLRQPVIALLSGHVFGGGLELAACADFRIAEEHVRIGQPEPSLGIVPGWSGTQRTVRRFGSQVIRRMALLGEVFSAREACDLGLVDRVVDTGQAMATAQSLADRIQSLSPRSRELVKLMINAAEGEEVDRVIDSLAGTIAAASDDLAEGLVVWRQNRREKEK
ncbi:MAG: enoyl-CoA hydratase/isomerase family protein [Rhodobacteraceae bacterium]|nr:enoyl-CoA hydratase/isomerase family protein [Paracoccaceae bacterium]